MRSRLALFAALASCVLALTTPARPAAKPALSGPLTIATAWPDARPFPIPALVDGASYQPLAIVADGDSIGTAASANGISEDLVEVANGRPMRVLASRMVAANVSFDAFAVTATDLYWMRDTADPDGQAHESLWAAPRAGGNAVLLTTDVGQVFFDGGANDLRVTGSELDWIATSSKGTEVRSIPLTGGAVTSTTFPGSYLLGQSPWLISAPGASGTAAKLLDTATGATTTVPAAANSTITCSLRWCVRQSLGPDGRPRLGLQRVTGGAATSLGGEGTDLVATDATLLDRFVALADQPNGPVGPDVVESLWLYDIAEHRDVQISAAATGAYARGDYVWWSTGDNETLAWSGLNLSDLRRHSCRVVH